MLSHIVVVAANHRLLVAAFNVTVYLKMWPRQDRSPPHSTKCVNDLNAHLIIALFQCALAVNLLGSYILRVFWGLVTKKVSGSFYNGWYIAAGPSRWLKPASLSPPALNPSFFFSPITQRPS